MARHPSRQQSGEAASGHLGRLFGLLRPYGGRLALVLGMLTVLALVNMAVPASIGLLLNEVFPDRTWWLLGLILPAILIGYLLRNLLFYASKYTSVAIGEQVSFQLRRRLFQRLQRRNVAFYRDRNPGELSSRIMDDTFAVQTFIQEEILSLIQATCMFVLLVLVLYVVNWRLALVTTVVLPVHLFVFRYYKRAIKQTSAVAQEKLASVHGSLVEKFLGMEVVKGFTAEHREQASFVEAIDESRKSQLASKKLHVLQKVVADLLIGISTVALLGFGAYQVMHEPTNRSPMQPGTFIAFWGFVLMLYPTVTVLMGGMAKVVKISACLDRIDEVMNEEVEDAGATDAFRGPVRGHLSFYWVGVGRHGGRPVLRDVTIEIPAGTFCVITGPSGSGKSTLVNLVPRFTAPDHGRILLDTMDLSTCDPKRLRESIGIAQQESFLFNATVLENLRYGNPDATRDEIESVADLTGAAELIAKLPDDYDTLLGERGWHLSRGEKQKLALTRALVKQPRILILDEATSSIDVAGEQKIIRAVHETMMGRTTLMITHRPELYAYADMLVVLDEGRVVYQGDTVELPPDVASRLDDTAHGMALAGAVVDQAG